MTDNRFYINFSYRKDNFSIESIKFTDFMNYFYDARAIGFSKKKSMKYAWDCCNSDMEKCCNSIPDELQ